MSEGHRIQGVGNQKVAICGKRISRVPDPLSVARALGSHLPAAGQRATERDFVRVLEVATDRQATRQPRHTHPVA
jgi:hypothetical protein